MQHQRPLILWLLVAYIFAPSIYNWATDATGFWLKPYLAWLAVVILAAILVNRRSDNSPQ